MTPRPPHDPSARGGWWLVVAVSVAATLALVAWFVAAAWAVAAS